jgi:hypothetical protein
MSLRQDGRTAGDTRQPDGLFQHLALKLEKAVNDSVCRQTHIFELWDSGQLFVDVRKGSDYQSRIDR